MSVYVRIRGEEPTIGPPSIIFKFCKRISRRDIPLEQIKRDIIPEIVVATAKIVGRQARGREMAL